jgi:hypothetical protein
MFRTYAMSEVHHFLERRRILAAHLPQTADPRERVKTFAVLRFEPVILVTNAWPRSDEAHLAPQHIDELRQFVQAGRAQEQPNRNNTWIAFEIEFVIGVGEVISLAR